MKVVIIAVLLMLSAICSATETAFSSCNRIRLKKLADDGNKSAKKAMNICDNFDKALTAILVGNNVVNISSSSLATVLFTEKFGKGSVGLATVVMTVLVLIFGEILPKSLAKENSERFFYSYGGSAFRIHVHHHTYYGYLYGHKKRCFKDCGQQEQRAVCY